MGAMENKSLNVFNTSLTLAREDTATDDDYERIEGVIGHEYFHNWTSKGLKGAQRGSEALCCYNFCLQNLPEKDTERLES